MDIKIVGQLVEIVSSGGPLAVSLAFSLVLWRVIKVKDDSIQKLFKDVMSLGERQTAAMEKMNKSLEQINNKMDEQRLVDAIAGRRALHLVDKKEETQ